MIIEGAKKLDRAPSVGLHKQKSRSYAFRETANGKRQTANGKRQTANGTGTA